jgi:uncharacterized protein (DUF2141 family)
MDSTSAPASVPLTLKLSELRSTQGVIRFALFSNAAATAFPKDSSQAIKTGSFPILAIPCIVTFSDIPFGNYALTLYHDENTNGKFDMGLLGIPQEGFGFSRNPSVWKGAPKFEQASFEFTADSHFVEVIVKYF